MKLADIPTPALILNHTKMMGNISKMHTHLARLKTPLRPHLKTCKSVEAAKLMLAGQPGGATVSTLSEADYFFKSGISDLIYAVPIAPGKLADVADLMAAGLDLKILLDSPEAAHAVTHAGAQRGVAYKTLLEIDSDGHRTGLKPGGKTLMETADILHQSAGARLMGVLTHAGSSYSCGTTQEIIQMAEQERSAAVFAAERLRSAGLPCPIVSVGSTPTAHFAQSLEGVTEVRAGVFVFQDLFQVSLGVCGYEDMGVAVLAEIIGRDPASNRLFIDAGALALSKDRSTAAAHEDMGFGLAAKPGAPVAQADLIVKHVFQEHGIIEARTTDADISRYAIGERLLIWPNHACMTAAAHGAYYVTHDGETVTTTWQRVNGWRTADVAAFHLAGQIC